MSVAIMRYVSPDPQDPPPPVEVDQQDAIASFKITKKFVDSNRGTAF